MNCHLVIGGSSGLGRAVVEHWLSKGEKVCSLSRTEPKIQSDLHTWVWCNLRDVKGLLEVARRIPHNYKFETVTVAAGVNVRHISQWDYYDQWIAHMESNCFGSSRLFEMLEREDLLVEHPTVVVFGSYLSKGSALYPAYAMAKAALWAYWRSKHLQRKGKLTVNQVWPGRVNTKGNPKRDLPTGDTCQFQEPSEVIPKMKHLFDPLPTNIHTLDLG